MTTKDSKNIVKKTFEKNLKMSIGIVVLVICGFITLFTTEALASGTLSPQPGTNNDVQINAALESGGVVHLNPGTYVIGKNLFINKDDTTLEGVKGTIIKLKDSANWAADNRGGMIQTQGTKNVRITGFEIDGNREKNTYSTLSTRSGHSVNRGQYFYTEIFASGVQGMEVDHMYLHDNWNDILRIDGSEDVRFHDDTVRNPGHDVVYATKSSYVYCYNNYVLIYCNSGFRAYVTSPMYVFDNVIGDESTSGWVGIEVQTGSAVGLRNNKFIMNSGHSEISGETGSVPSSVTADHAPEYWRTDSRGRSILENDGDDD